MIQRNSVTRTDCNFPRVAICYNNCFTVIKEREKFILHFTKYDMFNGTWSWLLIDELGLSSRVRDMNKFCWEGTFEKLPVVSVTTNIQHFLFTLLSFHKPALELWSTGKHLGSLSNMSFDRPSLFKTWAFFYSTREGTNATVLFKFLNAKDRKIDSPHITKCDTMKLNKIKQRP